MQTTATTNIEASEQIIKQAENELSSIWSQIDEVKNHNQIKVLEAFKKAQIQSSHFAWVTGYGHDDLGKEKLDEVFSYVFNTEAALVRPHFVSGTHAISTAILGNLQSGDELVAIGKPYDTLQTVFKKFEQKYKVNYKEVNYDFANAIQDRLSSANINEIKNAVSEKTKLVFIQRSRGYEWRDSLSLEELKELISTIKKINSSVIVFVDNCYGEFTQELEPTDLGADIIAGSLIKNPGAGIVAAGGYIAGKKEFVHNAAEQLTAPGIGPEGGCMFDQSRLMFQGLFMAPLIVSESLKGMVLAAKIFEDMELETIPKHNSARNDLIQAIKFNDKEKLLNFCKLVQNHSPVNSIFTPIADDIPGYDDQVVMAAGTFIEGSTVELSADGPIREPYLGYFQGGLSYSHTRYVISKILDCFKNL